MLINEINTTNERKSFFGNCYDCCYTITLFFCIIGVRISSDSRESMPEVNVMLHHVLYIFSSLR